MIVNLTQTDFNSLDTLTNDNVNLNNLQVVSIFQKAFLDVRAGSEDYYAGNEYILAGNEGTDNIITYAVNGLKNLEVVNG